jgi:hypothetical protein
MAKLYENESTPLIRLPLPAPESLEDAPDSTTAAASFSALQTVLDEALETVVEQSHQRRVARILKLGQKALAIHRLAQANAAIEEFSGQTR